MTLNPSLNLSARKIDHDDQQPLNITFFAQQLLVGQTYSAIDCVVVFFSVKVRHRMPYYASLNGKKRKFQIINKSSTLSAVCIGEDMHVVGSQ
ncbi:hypothetical protein J3459_022564 [Metarhizium acridum]|nr:hypothetical protein J3459_022564 [Metarhizium acridum]